MPDDYIKRSDALTATCENCTEHYACNGICDDTDRLSKIPAADVEPKCRWVSVTERLPEVDEEVLIYAVGKTKVFSSVIAITERFIFRLFPISEGTEMWRSPWQYFNDNYEITHWMPLPDPPKEEDDGE